MTSRRRWVGIRHFALHALAIALCLGLGLVAPAAAESAAEAVAPAGSGAVVSAAAPAVAPRSEIERAWVEGGTDLRARAARMRLRALDLGADGVEGAARALLAPEAAQRNSGDDLGRAMAAVRLAPDLPSVHLALARGHWDEGERGMAIEQLMAGLWAMPRHLESSIWLAATFLAIFVAVAVLGSAAFIALAGIRVMSHAAHDLGDLFGSDLPSFAGTALLGALLLVPLIFGEGLFGILLVLLAVAVAYGDSRHRMALTLAGVLIVIGMYPLVEIAGRSLDAVDADPVASAALSASRDSAGPAELALLREAADEDSLAAHAMALHARRVGDEQTAFERYGALLERTPRDPVVLANLANLHFRRGDVDATLGLYEKAAQLDDSPRLMFNLSQAYARAFRMEEFEKALQIAQHTGAEEVVDLSRLGDPAFMADLALPVHEIRMRMINESDGSAFARVVAAPLAPGLLGASWMHTAAGLVVAALLGAMIGGRYDHSSRCKRCGTRICARCDGTVWNSETCDGCHMLFHRPENTDGALRMARLTALRARETRIGRLSLLSSLLVPGSGGLLAGRPDLAYVGLLLAGWAIGTVVWRHGVVVDPFAVGSAGPLILLLTGAMAMTGYVIVVTWGWLIRRSL